MKFCVKIDYKDSINNMWNTLYKTITVALSYILLLPYKIILPKRNINTRLSCHEFCLEPVILASPLPSPPLPSFTINYLI
jgi:hypothetical protein